MCAGMMVNVEDFWLPSAESAPSTLLPTPPMVVKTPSWHRRPQHVNRTHSNSSKDDDIPRPAKDVDVSISSGKMLALPIPSVRPVDINVRREAGYMGMNPITLTGETGMLLPGTWGKGKEFVNVMPWKGGQRMTRQSTTSVVDAQLSSEQITKESEVVDIKELRGQYSRAVVKGNVCEGSTFDSPPLSLYIQPRGTISESKRCEEDHSEEDWEDISENEGAVNQQKNVSQRREGPGYCSSGGVDLTGAVVTLRKPAILFNVKKQVRFDEEAVGKQQKGKV